MSQISHDQLLVAMLVMGVPQLITFIIWGYQHKLIWADYKRRHKINGDSKEAHG